MRNLADIVTNYLAAALWTNEMDEFSAVCDIDTDTKAEATVHCQRFLKEADSLLTEEWTDEQIGHDLWLTRGGHGAGFWDRNKPNAKEISEIASKNEFHGLVFEADGVVYIDGDEPKL